MATCGQSKHISGVLSNLIRNTTPLLLVGPKHSPVNLSNLYKVTSSLDYIFS